MTRKKFEKYAVAVVQDCLELLRAKGEDYSRVDDYAFVNFERRALSLGTSAYEVLLTDLEKHLDCIRQAVSVNPHEPEMCAEPLEHRIKDAINYLLLLSGMLCKDRLKSNPENNANSTRNSVNEVGPEPRVPEDSDTARRTRLSDWK